MPRPPRRPIAHRVAHVAARALTAGACVVAAAPGALAAQGRTAAPLLVLPASARAAAMGEAYVATAPTAGDAAALFYNPAQLAGLPGTVVALSVERYLASSTQGAAAASFATRRLTFGAGVLALDYPDAAEIIAGPGDEPGTPSGRQVGAHELVAGVAAAAGGARARAGVMAKYIAQSLPGASGGAAAVDLGAAARVLGGAWGRVDVAAALQHVGGRLTTGAVSSPLPRTWRAGVSLDGAALLRGRWTAQAELVGARDTEAGARVGAEGVWAARELELAARAGWATREDGELARPLTLGAGLRRRRLSLDYAWRGFAELGDTHRVGVRWQR